MDEIVFFHRPSRTVIVADLIEAFSDRFLREHWRWWQRPLARIDGIVADKALAPLEWRLSFLNRAPARTARAKVLTWPCERVIIAHGDWPRSDGHAFLARSLGWLADDRIPGCLSINRKSPRISPRCHLRGIPPNHPKSVT